MMCHHDMKLDLAIALIDFCETVEEWKSVTTVSTYHFWTLTHKGY